VLVLLLEQRTSLARELGLSTGGVKSQVFRARQQLARALTA
jgi:DNA-directed RNA polymerase specialized sigma24 family protein